MNTKEKRMQNWSCEVQKAANHVRLRVLESVVQNGGGYMSQACSSAEMLCTLYMHTMNLNMPAAPIAPRKYCGVPGNGNKGFVTGVDFNGGKDSEHDYFYLSPTQYSVVLYAVLIESGRMTEEALSEFNTDGSSLEQIGATHSPGMEVMTGSLGQTISQAAGVALGRKLNGHSGRVFVFLGDGELQSGQTWEAFQAMSFYHLDNMVVYVDVNGHQVDGNVSETMNIEPLDKRFEAFGARVFRIDGHDIEALDALGKLKSDGRPTVILADTDVFRGCALLRERAPKTHYLRFVSDEEKARYQALLEEMKATQKEIR